MEGPPRSPRPRRVGGEGDVEVFVADEQDVVAIDVERWRELAMDVLSAEGVRGNAELSLLFVDEQSIAELNSEFLGKDGPTDVLAFPIDADDIVVSNGRSRELSGPDRNGIDSEDIPLLLGDVVICPMVAVDQAPTHAGTVDDEFALLVVHGVLHVLGHDHSEEADTAVMRRRELELLMQLHWHGPVPEGFRQAMDDE
jgi:probable rRNA maturation factor